jgi:hypothetical protein
MSGKKMLNLSPPETFAPEPTYACDKCRDRGWYRVDETGGWAPCSCHIKDWKPALRYGDFPESYIAKISDGPDGQAPSWVKEAATWGRQFPLVTFISGERTGVVATYAAARVRIAVELGLRQVAYRNAVRFDHEWAEARATEEAPKVRRQLVTVRLLLVHDLGYIGQREHHLAAWKPILVARYQDSVPTVITSRWQWTSLASRLSLPELRVDERKV